MSEGVPNKDGRDARFCGQREHRTVRKLKKPGSLRGQTGISLRKVGEIPEAGPKGGTPWSWKSDLSILFQALVQGSVLIYLIFEQPKI